MTRFVVGHDTPFFFVQNSALALQPRHGPFDGLAQLVHRDRCLVSASGEQRRLVDHIGQICARETRGSSRQPLQIGILSEFDLSGVNAQDRLATLDVGTVHGDGAIEAAGSEQRRIEDLGAICRGHQNDASIGRKAVQLGEQLIQRLLALVVSPKRADPTRLSKRIKFVDEDDGRCVFLGLLEQISHTCRAHTDKHFDKVGSTDREKGHTRFACHRFGQQGLAGSR